MSDLHLNFRAQPHEQPGDDDAREARHQVLATLLGAYADAELPPETVAQIDAHLLGCARCRREVELHTSLRDRLSREPLAVASPALRNRISDELRSTAVLPAPSSASVAAASRPSRALIAWLGAGAVVLALAVAFGMPQRRTSKDAVIATPAPAAIDAGTVPLFADVLGDYRRVMASDLPGRARDLDAVRAAVSFPVEPLHVNGLRLLAAWSTAIRGEPAAVLAYRWEDRLVLQYLVAEPAFFASPLVRPPVAAGHAVAALSGSQGMLAWAGTESGVVLVSDVPPAALVALRVGGPGR